MRQQVKTFIQVVIDTLKTPEPIYEFGSFQVPEQGAFADLRPLFPGKKYIGADVRPGPGVDVLLDLHHIALPQAAAGTVLCLDTLEHVKNPMQAVREMFRIMHPDGICVITSCMNFPIHNHPNDYWRFTPAGFRLLLDPFTHYFVGHISDAKNPHLVVGIGTNSQILTGQALTDNYKNWAAEP